jgi:hypothetical protein
MAVWSYWRGGKRFRGALEGNIFSATWKEGWIWIIPLKDDTYSVGVVTGIEANASMREIGPEAFYLQTLQSCPLAAEILATAEQCEGVRVLRDWSYEARHLALGRAFLCGDSACFIDPLFSQGVHLATYSATLAAAAIDHLYDHPADAAEVRAWYDSSYPAAYARYHKFLAAFYAFNGESDSQFWASRKIAGAADERFDGKEWFTALSGQPDESGAAGVAGLAQGASTLAQLWQHGTPDLTDEYDEAELAQRRVQWAGELLREVRALTRIRWTGAEARLVPTFKVDPRSFKLERAFLVGDEAGRTVSAYALGEAHRALFESLIVRPLSYRALSARLKQIDRHQNPLLLIRRFLEEGLLQGYDRAGEPARITSPMRFGGVGADDDIS